MGNLQPILEELLARGEVTVKFNKADGTERTMRCTKNFDMIPVDHHPAEHEAVEYEDLLKVYDLDIGEWRAFKPSRVLEWVA